MSDDSSQPYGLGHPGGEIQEVPEDAFRTSEKSENFTQVSC